MLAEAMMAFSSATLSLFLGEATRAEESATKMVGTRTKVVDFMLVA